MSNMSRDTVLIISFYHVEAIRYACIEGKMFFHLMLGSSCLGILIVESGTMFFYLVKQTTGATDEARGLQVLGVFQPSQAIRFHITTYEFCTWKEYSVLI